MLIKLIPNERAMIMLHYCVEIIMLDRILRFLQTENGDFYANSDVPLGGAFYVTSCDVIEKLKR